MLSQKYSAKASNFENLKCNLADLTDSVAHLQADIAKLVTDTQQAASQLEDMRRFVMKDVMWMSLSPVHLGVVLLPGRGSSWLNRSATSRPWSAM